MNGIKLPAKVRNIDKIEWKNQSALVFLVTKLRKNTQSMYQKIFKKKRVDFLLIEKRGKNTMFLSKILTRPCVITQ